MHICSRSRKTRHKRQTKQPPEIKDPMHRSIADHGGDLIKLKLQIKGGATHLEDNETKGISESNFVWNPSCNGESQGLRHHP